MQTYFQIIRNTWDQALAYRTSFILFRVREVLQLLSMYFIWLFVIPENGSFSGYTQATMLTYVLAGAFINDIIFSTRTTAIATEINDGTLTNFLIRPMSYLKYHFFRDFGDKAMNISFSLVEITIIFFLLHPPFILQTNMLTILLLVMSILLGVVMHFFISCMIGFIGFWSNEGWGPRFIFYQAVGFFSGSLFPLDVLPDKVFSIIKLLPFTYLTFFPTKIYLGQLSIQEILQGFLVCGVWIVLLFFLSQFIWRKGLKVYTAQGR
jgi:ABC-2 type transport system permease protein